MWIFIFCVIVALLFTYKILIWQPARAQLPQDVACSERHAIQTADGIVLTLYRYRPETAPRMKYPLIMCHGMSVNRFHFDNGSDISIARYFQKAGFDVWLLELRGCGNSTPPPLLIPDQRFTFDHYVRHDVPDAIEYVRQKTKAEKVHWLGHSLGGMVFYGYVTLFGDDPIASATLIASAVDFSMWTTPNRRLYWKLFYYFCCLLPSVPHRYFTRAFFPIIPWLMKKWPYPPGLMKIINGDNLSRLQLWQFFYNALSNLPRGLVLQSIRWVAEGDLKSVDGRHHYLEGARKLRCPLLIVASKGDVSIPIRTIQPGYDYALSEDKQFKILEPTRPEHAILGHADMIYSYASYTEFFPFLRAWVAKRDSDWKIKPHKDQEKMEVPS
ncbi:alpha/beta fold hydrolase [candidate division CSSED10-310 bacterium]|uniref:Alpha/beta fold hydrolase n=1 Tax=candidate division CSSED10-310 bacterium TaxID=2855610 RepID=A0ABV6Z607_UNCC1